MQIPRQKYFVSGGLYVAELQKNGARFRLRAVQGRRFTVGFRAFERNAYRLARVLDRRLAAKAHANEQRYESKHRIYGTGSSVAASL